MLQKNALRQVLTLLTHILSIIYPFLYYGVHQYLSTQIVIYGLLTLSTLQIMIASISSRTNLSTLCQRQSLILITLLLVSFWMTPMFTPLLYPVFVMASWGLVLALNHTWIFLFAVGGGISLISVYSFSLKTWLLYNGLVCPIGAFVLFVMERLLYNRRMKRLGL